MTEMVKYIGTLLILAIVIWIVIIIPYSAIFWVKKNKELTFGFLFSKDVSLKKKVLRSLEILFFVFLGILLYDLMFDLDVVKKIWSWVY